MACAVALLVLPTASGCGKDPVDDYCEAVKEHQTALTELVSQGGPEALIGAIDIFADLEDRAPSDIQDEWQLVVRRIEVLTRALDDAGLDPATYDRDDPPVGLTQQQKAEIDAAARELGSGQTLAAFEGLQQQARDVCKTPLSL